VIPAWRVGHRRLQLVAWCPVGGSWHRHFHGLFHRGTCDRRGTAVCDCPIGSGDGHRASTCNRLGYYVREQPGSPPVRGRFGRGWRDAPPPELGMIELAGVGL
jgi:hypothetical protein